MSERLRVKAAALAPAAEPADVDGVIGKPAPARAAVAASLESLEPLAFDPGRDPGRVALWADRDLRWAQRMNRIAQRRAVAVPLRLASRLADGPMWYALIAGLFLFGDTTARFTAIDMAITGGICLIVYLALKRITGRHRPYVRCNDITVCARVLDEFSFPSGHVLHAVAFTVVLGHAYPGAAAALWPFVLLVAASRVVLGLHFPSDVAAGAALGGLVALLVIGWG
jgi:undecaprenyl-diphosphatase